jgi:hypothetical protein
MPYCRFCGKLCPTVPGLNRHLDIAPNCKKASREEFSQYANTIWNDVPENPDDVQQQPLPNLPIERDSDLPDFSLEEDIQRAEEILNGEGVDIPTLPPPLRPLPLRPHVPDNDEVLDGRRYIEKFPEEYLAGATWGNCKPLYEYLDEQQKKEGGSRWGPFEDEDEWRLAEWLIRNVGQKQTDIFLKLPIVSFLVFFFWKCFND